MNRTDHLTAAAQALQAAATQDAEAAALRAAIETETETLTHAQADRRRAHRKATRKDRPASHHIGRREEAAALARIEATQNRITALRAELDHYTADADRLRKVAADHHAAAGHVTLDLPAAFDTWFADTGLALGHDDTDPECKATRQAWQQGTPTPDGGRRITTGNPTVLRVLTEYTDTLLFANQDEPDPAEVRAAETLAQRLQTARMTLRTTQAQQEAQEAPQAAQEAPTGPVLADWERELLAQADTLPTATREPSADLNIAQGDDPQGPQQAAPVSVYVTTADGDRIEYAHIPNGDPARVAHFLNAARSIPAYTDASTEQHLTADRSAPAALNAARLLSGLTVDHPTGRALVTGHHLTPTGTVTLTVVGDDHTPRTVPLTDATVTDTDRPTFAQRIKRTA
ncbi:hypothetical protein ACPCSE_29320 [Streptomyces cellulosae]